VRRGGPARSRPSSRTAADWRESSETGSFPWRETRPGGFRSSWNPMRTPRISTSRDSPLPRVADVGGGLNCRRSRPRDQRRARTRMNRYPFASDKQAASAPATLPRPLGTITGRDGRRRRRSRNGGGSERAPVIDRHARSSSEARASRASVSVPALLATRSLLVVWAGGDAGCRCAGIGDVRARGATLVRQRFRLCSSAVRGCEPSAFIPNTTPLHSAVAREGDPACRLAEPRLSGFAGQATLAWATF